MTDTPKTKPYAFSVPQLQLVFFGLCIVLSIILYFQGGATNPFVSLFLVPIAIAAATLSTRFTISLAAFCVLAYSLLMFYYQPMQLLSPSHDMTVSGHHHSMDMDNQVSINWHVLGMWLNFVLSTLLIIYFVLRMARALRDQDAELAAIREQQLRDEQLLGIATLAAGTLHELGTPLSTMTVITEDLQHSAKDHPELADDLQLLGEQLARCKLSLQNLARAAEQSSQQLQRVAIDDFLRDVLAHWLLLKPGVPLQKNIAPIEGFLKLDSTLEQAIINLLNNAAEASPSGIEVTATANRESDMLTIAVRDHGPGMPSDAENIGKPFVSTRGQGRGLGLFLSNATIERLGGQVMLQEHPDGGILTTITFPREP
jgi:two-component system sensor histidine kinase RegB